MSICVYRIGDKMPIYEYECNICNQSKESLQKLGEEHLVLTCEQCGQEAMERVVSLSYVRFKGVGLYKPSEE